MKPSIHVLYVDDSHFDRALVLDSLEKEHGGFQVTQAVSRIDFESALATGTFDLVLSDFNILGFEGLQVLEAVHQKDPNLPVIIVTGTGSEEIAVEAMKRGAADYVIKTAKHIQRLPVTIQAALEKKQLQENYRQAQERYRSIYENAVEGIYQSTQKGRYVSVNPAMARIYGYATPEEMIEQVTDIESQIYVRPQDRSEFIRLLVENGKVNNFEVQNYRRDGSMIWVRSDARLVETEGFESYFEGFLSDITEHKKAEQDVQDNQLRLESIFNSAMDAIIIIDEAQNIVIFNPAAEQMFRCKSGEMIGRPVEQFIPEESRARHAGFVRKFGETGVTRRSMSKNVVPLLCLRATGESFPAEISISQFEVAGQRFYTAIVRDVTERTRAEEKIKRQIEYLTALREIDQAITSTFDMRISLDILVLWALTLLHVDAVAVLLFNSAANILEFAAGAGFWTPVVTTSSVKLGESYAGKAVLERRIIAIPNLADERNNLFLFGFLKEEKFVSYYGVPLTVKGRIIGVLEIFKRSVIEQDAEWFNLLNTLAGQAAVAIDNAKLFEDLQISNTELNLAYEATIEGWSHALDLRDKETEGHTLRVTEKTLELAHRMGIPEHELPHIRRGALLHDIGKMGVPDSILLKADTLTDPEREILQKHPVFAFELLSPIRYLKSAAIDIPYCHHEKWDGTGYPRGIKKEQIPLAARIFAVVDVYDAITSDRPYRAAWSKEKAIEHIKLLAGTHFDPLVVQVFLQMIDK